MLYSHGGRTAGRAGRRASRTLRRVVMLALSAALLDAARATPPLPVACAAGTCGASGPSSFVTQGAATLQSTGSTLTVNQSSASALLNWQSFNIGAGGTVTFAQPSTSSIALNRIFQGSPSQIFGTLKSNGTIYLLNQNGFLFGTTAVVNVGGLLASSLNISPDALRLGIAQAAGVLSPAFQPYTDAAGKALPSGDVLVQNGATITASGGQVMLFAPKVENDGLIQTPDGQTILGAGQRVFLTASSDPNIRGLLIEVGSGGTVTNGGTGSAGGGVGQIIADRGNVTLAGLAVNQSGRISATTSTQVNGSILLLANDTTGSQLSTPGKLQFNETGTLTLGPSSTTAVSLQGSSTDLALDVTTQPKSLIELQGGTVTLGANASVLATSGNVTVSATGPAGIVPGAAPDASRILLEAGAVIDVSGATISESVSDNSLAVQLRGSELANDPAQRDGALRGQTVYVDVRNSGVSANGTAWVGTPLADLTADVGTIERNVYQRNLTGGTVSITSSGSVIVSPNATVNISGGQIDWQAGYVKSSVLLGTNGITYNIGAANPNQQYVGTLDSISVNDPRWGTAVSAALFGHNPLGTYQQGYVEGKDAGVLTIVAPAAIIDGTVAGQATIGPLQRQPAATIPSGQLYRPYNQVPLAGELVLGNASALSDPTQQEVLGSVRFAPGSVLSTLSGPSGGAFDPTTDPLPAGFVTTLHPDLLGADGVGRLAVYSEGEITVPSDVTLAPGAGGALTLAAGRVNFDGTVVAPSGSVALSAIPTALFNGQFGLPLPGLIAGATAAIDVRGEWINDSPLVTPLPQLPLFINGGSATLTAQGGSLVMPSGATIDVSGGAQRTTSGSVTPGRGGNIVINDQPGIFGNASQAQTVFAPTLRGLGLTSGGSVSVALPALCLSSQLCPDAGAVRIDPSFLTGYGFARLSLGATTGGLEVESDVDLQLAQRNWQLLPAAATAPSSASLSGLVSEQVLPAYARQPANLSLTTALPIDPSQPHSDLLVATGATIATDPGGSLSLSTPGRIIDNGTLIAPGGSVTLALTTVANPLGLVSNQALWLGPTALIDVSGTTVYTPNPLGLRTGMVLPGGNISLLANSGYLIALPGSELDARGGSGSLDLRQSASSAQTERLTIATSGGAIALFGAEGLQFDGTMHADAGAGVSATGAAASGGALTVTVNGDLGTGASRSIGAYPTTPRELVITASDIPIVIGESASVPLSLNGQGRIAAPTINAGGFDQVELVAADLLASNGSAPFSVAVGTVAFESGVMLAPRIALGVQAGEILGLGQGSVQLSAPYVALGSADTATQSINSAPSAGGATLSVHSGTIDLIGAFDVAGFSAATLSSSGDIRLIGVQTQGTNTFTGRLVSAGSLELAAQQVYPDTLTQYAVSLTGTSPASGHLLIDAVTGTPGPVLSAAGSVTLNAQTIDDAGTLKAPFGSIVMNAGTVNLLPGSVTTVAGDGVTIPFGETQGGLAWIYPLNSAVTQVYSATGIGALPPQKQVSINASTFNLSSGATVDISGGGDLQAFEYTAGTGGTIDVLSNLVNPNLYAVLPGKQLPAAPGDPLMSQGFTLGAGSSVYLAGANGLPAGTYTLLPARYALLPGAFLVQAVAGYTDIAPSSPIAQLDGSVVTAGYRTFGQTAFGATRWTGFDVMPGAYALQEASYTLTSANGFFGAQAQAAGTPSPRLPQDAGSLSIGATLAASLAGSVDASHLGTGSRGSSVDISSANLYISGDSAGAPAGYVTLDPSQLDALGAESLLLGGTRTATQAGVALSVGASNVVVAGDASLSGQELLLAASGTVQLAAGASVQASGTAVAAEPALLLPVGAALVRTSTGAQQAFTFTGAKGNGSIEVAPSAVIAGTGSIAFDSGGTIDFQGVLQATGASVRLASNTIAIGAVPAGFSGFALTPSLLTGLGSSNLQLASPNSVEFFGSSTLSLTGLALLAPGVIAETPGASLGVDAQSIVLSGTANGIAVPPTAGSGAVSLNAQSLHLAGGSFAFAGVATTSLTATGAVISDGGGTLASAGNLTIASPQLAASGAFNMAISAAGSLAVAGSAAPTASSIVAAPGGGYALSGADVSIDTAIRSPAGQLVVTASSGDIVLGSHALVDVAGFSRDFLGTTVSAAGGTVSLTASSGNIAIDAATVIDVSAGSGSGTGGSLSLTAATGSVALAGALRGAGASGQSGAALSLDAVSFPVGALFDLNATGGFTGALSAHLRGPGDINLPAGQAIRTGDLTLTADQGSVTIGGTVDASSANGSTLTLAASGNVSVDGTLLANATASAVRGGSINLLSEAGGVYLGPLSELSVGGTSGAGATAAATATGAIWIRVPESSALSVLNTDPATRQLQLAGTISGAASVAVEGYRAYASSGTIGAPDEFADPSNPIYGNAQTFMASAPAISTALGRAGDATFSVLPGIEIDAPGDLHLASAWDLSTWRFGPQGTVPGALTIRAGGNLYVDASLSDGFPGFDPYYGYQLTPGFGASWSYRLVAGADFSSSQPLAVRGGSGPALASGDVVVARGIPSDLNGVNGPTVIRTGTGFIDIAAARDLVLSNQASVIYTAGAASAQGLELFDTDSGFQGQSYPVGGGSVLITVGRDVTGAVSNQLFSDWLWRAGTSASSPVGYTPSAWTISYGNFEQGIAAFGGGDLTIVAGRNLVDVGANVTTTGIPIGDGSLAGTQTIVSGAGLLTVKAGGDIDGGKFLGMAAGATVSAGGSIGIGSPIGRFSGTYPVLGLGSDVFTVTSRQNATLETIVNPTLLPRSTLQPVGYSTLPELYSTYGDQSAAVLTSAGGNLVLAGRTAATDPLAQSLPNLLFSGFFNAYNIALRALPPNLTAAALAGNVTFNGSFDLTPSPHGTLDILAAGGVTVATSNGAGPIHLSQADTDPALLGTVANPAFSLAGLSVLDASSTYAQGVHAPEPVPNQIVALSGDIVLQSSDVASFANVLSAKPINVFAGRDIVDLGLQAENVAPGNVDTVTAGRDLIFDTGRSSSGILLGNTRSIDVSGPGALLVQAGRNVNLGTSFGITTSGSLSNPALPATGADVSVVAGAGAGPDYAAFIAQYITNSSTYDAQLASYVAALTGTTPATKAAAVAAFQGLGSGAQVEFVDEVFIAEMRAGGRAAAAAGASHNNYTRAFDALETLFPSSNPDVSSGQVNPYQGDILLYFSRINTLAGGNIDLYAPGGQINVGLAAAPSTFGITKPASQLGIVAAGVGSVSAVAYSDVQVNQSRIFAANGGDILIWSTEGNIDAGRGAKTAISAPPPVITVSASGQVTSVFPPALTGSGIQAIATSAGTKPGDVDLFAPHGVVNANDAGIVAGNLTIAATAVLGASNITVTGTSVGVPVQATGLGVSLSSAASSSTAASGLSSGVSESGEKAPAKSPLADTALNWLDVFVIGLGEEACRPDDLDCLRRQKRN